MMATVSTQSTQTAPDRFRDEHRCHQGFVRVRNEDSLLVLPSSGLWAVADGMGGHRGGDVASGALVEALAENGSVAQMPLAEAVATVENTVCAVHQALQREAQDRGLEPSGSTLAAAIPVNDLMICLWIGDSRIYRISKSGITQISRDHSDAEGRLCRAVGNGEDCWLDIGITRLHQRDRLLIATDGLTRELSDGCIGAFLAPQQSLAYAADGLLDAALRSGARDNIAFIVVEAL
jgi:serine/threonine protein phosphatase PrpC